MPSAASRTRRRSGLTANPGGEGARWCALLSRLAEELRDGRQRLQCGQFFFRGQLRSITYCVDHAEKTKRFFCGRAKLVPCPGRDGDQIELAYPTHLVADQALAAAAQDHPAMSVFMTLQG